MGKQIITTAIAPSRAFVYSLCVHVLLAIFLLFSLAQSPVHLEVTQAIHSPKTQMVKAVAIDNAAVEKEVKQLMQTREQKRAKAIAHEKKLQRLIKAARVAKIKREKEQRRLRLLRKQQKERRLALQKQQRRAQAEKEKNRQALTQLKKQRAEAKRKLKALEAKRLALARAQAKALKAKQAEQKQAEQMAQYRPVINRYMALIIHQVQQNWILPANIQKASQCMMLVQLSKQGMVLKARIIRSSGNLALDRSAVAAVYRASPLPIPQKPAVLYDNFREIKFTVSPKGYLNRQQT